MSSDNMSAVQGTRIKSLQDIEQQLRHPVPNQISDAERNKIATQGQDLPPAAKDDAQQPEKVESAVSQIRDYVQNFQRDLVFTVDRESDRLVVKVVDSETQKVIRQIPSEDTLRMAENLNSPDSLIIREQA